MVRPSSSGGGVLGRLAHPFGEGLSVGGKVDQAHFGGAQIGAHPLGRKQRPEAGVEAEPIPTTERALDQRAELVHKAFGNEVFGQKWFLHKHSSTTRRPRSQLSIWPGGGQIHTAQRGQAATQSSSSSFSSSSSTAPFPMTRTRTTTRRRDLRGLRRFREILIQRDEAATEGARTALSASLPLAAETRGQSCPRSENRRGLRRNGEILIECSGAATKSSSSSFSSTSSTAPFSDDENEDDDEDERFARPATIWTDTDRVDGANPSKRKLLIDANKR